MNTFMGAFWDDIRKAKSLAAQIIRQRISHGRNGQAGLAAFEDVCNVVLRYAQGKKCNFSIQKIFL